MVRVVPAYMTTPGTNNRFALDSVSVTATDEWYPVLPTR